MPADPDCLFCRIVAGEIPSDEGPRGRGGRRLPRHRPARPDPHPRDPARPHRVGRRPDRGGRADARPAVRDASPRSLAARASPTPATGSFRTSAGGAARPSTTSTSTCSGAGRSSGRRGEAGRARAALRPGAALVLSPPSAAAAGSRASAASRRSRRARRAGRHGHGCRRARPGRRSPPRSHLPAPARRRDTAVPALGVAARRRRAAGRVPGRPARRTPTAATSSSTSSPTRRRPSTRATTWRATSGPAPAGSQYPARRAAHDPPGRDDADLLHVVAVDVAGSGIAAGRRGAEHARNRVRATALSLHVRPMSSRHDARDNRYRT